jgi:tripartite ATP-independent transporter DctP family solute receptor
VKKTLALLLVVILVLMAGCSGGSEKTTTAENTSTEQEAPAEATQAKKETEEKSFTLKFNCLENEAHAQGQGVMAFKKKVEELSNGQITVEPYFSSSLFTQEGAITALMSGQLEMTYVAFQQVAEFYPTASMFGATYMFKNYEHARKTFDSEIGKELYENISNSVNYVPITAYYNGSRQLNLRTKTPITKPEDLKGTVLRMPNAASWIAAGESLGAKVTPLAYAEVYTALQTGTIDAQDNPLLATKTMNFYEVTNQISLTYHIIDFGVMSINKDIWEQMTPKQQEWIYQAAKAAQEVIDGEQIKAENELIEFFESEGLIIVNPDIEAFRKHSFEYYESKGLTEDWDMDLYNKIQAMAN